jgi:hypothetical protein
MASQPAVKAGVAGSGKAVSGAPRKAARVRMFDYSRYRVPIQKPEDFAQYVAGYPSKAGLVLYIYRLAPKIDFGLISVKEHTIRKVWELENMNTEWVAKEFGRGRYQFKLNDKMRDKGQTEVCNMVFDISDPELEPIYDVRTLCLGHSENIDEINRLIEKGALIRDGNGQPRLRTERDGPLQNERAPVASNGSQELIPRDLVGQMFVSLIAKATQDPNQAIEQSIKIAQLLRPETSAATGLTVEQVLKLIDSKLAAAGGRDDPFAAWERIDAFLAKARGGVSAVVGAATSDATLSGFSEVLKSAAVLIPQVIQGIDFLQKQRMRLAVQINGNGVARESAPGASARVDNGNVAQPMTLADRIAEVLKLGFQKMSEGTTGFDFASYVCNWHEGGVEVYRFLEPRGAVGVLGLLVMNPEASAIVNDPARRPQIEAFLTDFFSYDPDGDQQGNGDEDEGEDPPLDGVSSAA